MKGVEFVSAFRAVNDLLCQREHTSVYRELLHFAHQVFVKLADLWKVNYIQGKALGVKQFEFQNLVTCSRADLISGLILRYERTAKKTYWPRRHVYAMEFF